MIDILKTKIRGLVEDFEKSDFETFEYKTSSIWTLAESNINSITKVLKNGSELGSGEYSYDSTTNKIEILASLSTGDIIEVDYTYYKYSDNELLGYISSALVWISLFSPCQSDFELELNEYIAPTPTNKEVDLISIIASILINPNWTEKRLPNLTVRYPKRFSKEEKIQNLISKFYTGLGVTSVIEWD